MKYQDELEAGRRSRKPEFSIAEQVEQYRRKQLRKVVIMAVITVCFCGCSFRETKLRSLLMCFFVSFQTVVKVISERFFARCESGSTRYGQEIGRTKDKVERCYVCDILED